MFLILLIATAIVVFVFIKKEKYIQKNNFFNTGFSVQTKNRDQIENDSLYKTNETPIKKNDTKSSATKISYTDALQYYKNAYMQFGENCIYSKTNQTYFKLGDEIMIDNRGSSPLGVQIGDFDVVIGPYDFSFLILSQKGTRIPVDCGDKKNVTFIQVQ